ncbi:hypothetical protein KC331_g266 [Hortaea werneckii]|uniref:Transcription initiation factor TFIID subunit 10 n=1 Tax=Hortaea werneckii TaxID=91943 RepID=A0A3M7EC68_HORWE|nr:hypothetical protein KC354_g2169 [Hortaea werneckii]KAI7554847.1 hypothetical protein KC331_g266 [Hortaea werneckii]KAI7718472.1 hypothetical protein KC353_g3764 [Hortaea werneckii]RMY40565.1 hypothetical protein D0865_12525 [Hortaea werneckii]RMY74010.1 hypothetical protein D0863_03496 [Hortaea werneckii]
MAEPTPQPSQPTAEGSLPPPTAPDNANTQPEPESQPEPQPEPEQQPQSQSEPQPESQPPAPADPVDHQPDDDQALEHEMGMNLDGTSEGPPRPASQPQEPSQPPPDAGPTIPSAVEPRIPQKKDASLREFLGKMDDYAPIIPDAVTDYYLTLAGLPPPPETDRRLARLMALATQKFVADIAADAYQYSRIRSTNTTSNNPLTGLGGAAGFGMNMPAGGEGVEGGGKGKKEAGGKNQPLGGPRAGYGGGGAGGGQGRTVLTMEDLGMAVGEYGVNVKRGEFYR